jgi:hypothetical protein
MPPCPGGILPMREKAGDGVRERGRAFDLEARTVRTSVGARQWSGAMR